MACLTNDRDISPTLKAAEQWIRNCLLEDRSIFSSSLLWTPQLIDEVFQAFVKHPDYGSDDFITKLQNQMKLASSSAQKLAAEMLWILLLFPSNIKPSTKRRQLRLIWALSGESIAESHPMLEDGVLMGIGSGGPGFNNYRPHELEYLIALVRDIKTRTTSERAQVFADYEAFFSWIDAVPRDGSRQFRHMLRYFAFPDKVERMSSNNHRRRVLEAFGVASSKDVENWGDRQLDEKIY